MKCSFALLSTGYAGNFVGALYYTKYNVNIKLHPGASVFNLESSSVEITFFLSDREYKFPDIQESSRTKSSKWLEIQLGDGTSVCRFLNSNALGSVHFIYR